MSGNTITHETTTSADPVGTTRGTSVAPSRAARELGLKRSEFTLAVHLGRIRTLPDDGGGGGRRVARDEIERIRAQQGFPEVLRESVRSVGTAEGAALMEVTRARFTRLARLGLLVPVSFYINRYRAVVWLYLADELRQFASDERNAALLKGRTPEGLRDQLTEGLDLRPRNWRGRHLGFLLRRADDDPWSRAAAVASLLDPVEVSEVVRDPCERSHLLRFRPTQPSHGVPGSPSAQLAEEIMTAADPDEIDWLRADLAGAVDAARRQRPAPRPVPRGAEHHPAPKERHPQRRVPHPERSASTPPGPAPRPPKTEARGRIRGLFGRLWRRDP
ncbi:hypothetical protein SAM40697_1083 [Streptomyces ambofaciens]|uniref:DNA-binding protein n=1 Tax=Streptomyces ambofaciens TaxID=1889 RepID=A0ABN4P1R1_STRAM|nr:DUF6397 family protein [Streptomyces ambofaciens]ANB05044.1 hypothetical protein SAM40697_1083 [Streptomyces ambofaciens]